MVKYLLILITVFNPLLVKGQTSISFSKDEFTIDRIISILFEGEFDYNTSECKWRPNLAEKLQFGESHDGFLYTVLDTTYTHKNYSSNLTTMIVTTYVKDKNGEKISCHACAPSFSVITFEFNNKRQAFVLREFYKYVDHYGGWGEPDDISTLKINSNITLLQVSGIWSGQGYTEKYKRWYYNGKEILYYVTHADNKGVTDNKAEIFEFNTKISVDENNSQLILYKFGTTKDENTSKIVTINQTSIYKFIDNRFERIVSKMK